MARIEADPSLISPDYSIEKFKTAKDHDGTDQNPQWLTSTTLLPKWSSERALMPICPTDQEENHGECCNRAHPSPGKVSGTRGAIA